jgi:hypothetical protein
MKTRIRLFEGHLYSSSKRCFYITTMKRLSGYRNKLQPLDYYQEAVSDELTLLSLE